MRKILITIILFLVCLFLYGRYIEVNNFKIHEYNIQNENIPSSFTDLKIIHFGDILFEPDLSEKALEKVVNKINDNEADIVIFSGDMLKKGIKYQEKDYEFIKKNLQKINASLYKFAVIGDNDQKYLQEYKDLLYESGFTLLDNQNFLLFYKDEVPINLIGITDMKEITDFTTLLNSDVSYNYTLAITHNSDNFDELKKHNINTILSGNSLGGMINIPFYGGIIKKSGSEKYLNNYYKEGESEVFITNGIGYEKYNFRLFNTPSINIYKFSK